MKAIIAITNQWSQDNIIAVDKNKGWTGEIEGDSIALETEDFEISTDDIPGWLVATEGNYTVALDETISPALKNEGIHQTNLKLRRREQNDLRHFKIEWALFRSGSNEQQNQN